MPVDADEGTGMRALVVYESMFGNTATVASAIAEGLRAGGSGEVDVVDVREAPSVVSPDVQLLVVGGPTHALGMSRPQTRRSAVEQGGNPAAAGTGLREWLAHLSVAGAAPTAATFTTKVRRPRLPGSAAKRAAARLRRAGIRTGPPAATFWVDGTSGPLVDGEVARAQAWGRELAGRSA